MLLNHISICFKLSEITVLRQRFSWTINIGLAKMFRNVSKQLPTYAA